MSISIFCVVVLVLPAAPFLKLPIGAIKSNGRPGKQLELQAEGFHERLIEISRFLVKENNAWLSATDKPIPEWKMDELNLVGLLPPSPVQSDHSVETIVLIPMEAARLRISAFPVIQ